VLGVGDTFSALIGKYYGKHRGKNGKSLEGMLAFNLSIIIFILILK